MGHCSSHLSAGLSQWQFNRVAQVLSQGGVIAYPTESVYGLGCNPYNESALSRILQLKQRPAHKGLIILVSQLEQAEPLIQPLTQAQRDMILQPNDRATTWLIPKQDSVSPLLSGASNKLAVRLTSHPFAKMICELTQQPLVSTSCNKAGKSELTQYSAVRNHWQNLVDKVVRGECGGQRPSRIIDLINHRVLRD
ncbi:L-threonylcarbamoyladenylate synthase [Aliikangiella sp. IMCC44632]